MTTPLQVLLLAQLVFANTVHCTLTTDERRADERYNELLQAVQAVSQRIGSLEAAVQVNLQKHNIDRNRMEVKLDDNHMEVMASIAAAAGPESSAELCSQTSRRLKAVESQLVDLICLHNENQSEQVACLLKDLIKKEKNVTSILSALVDRFRATISHSELQEYLLAIGYFTYLVKDTRLPDSRITASSTFWANHEAKRVRIDNYFDPACAWVGSRSDSDLWVQFDLQTEYVGVGMLIRRRCDDPHTDQYATLISVRYSADADSSTWASTSPEEVVPVYGGPDMSYTLWFQQPVSARYWRIYVLQYNDNPSLKADIIGIV